MVTRVVQNEVQEAPESRARFQAADYGAAGEIRARALQGFGQQMGQAVNEIDDLTYRFDVAAAKKADSEDAVELAKLRAEAMNAIGTDAPIAAEGARTKAEEIKKRRLAELKGRRGELYANSFNGRMAQFEESLVGHTVKQVDVAERGAAGARAETSLALAADGYAEPEIYQSNMDTAEGEYRRANKGTSEDQLTRGWAIERSKNHVNIVQQIMSDPENADKAEDWIDKHATEIDPQQEPELRRMIRPAIEAQEEDADFSRVLAFANGNPDATVPDDGQDDAGAPTAVVPRLRGEPVRDVFNHVVGGKGRITNTATQHRLRGSGNGIDIAAREGSPIRPPMSGKVLAEGWSEKGGWAMTIQHPNGKITGYAHMRSRTPLRKGEDVDSTTVIGSVGSTGKSTGPHLHFTVRENGAKVDPQSVDWTAAGEGPGTIDPTKVKWKEGALPKPSAEQNQLGSLLNATYEVATREGWSMKRFERATARIKQFAGTQEQLANEQEQVQWDSAVERLVELDGGNGLTDPRKQIPNFGRLEPARQLQLLGIADSNKKAAAGEGGALKANGPAFVEYALMGANPDERDAFLKMDFRADPNITAGERARLTIQQQRLRNDSDGALAANIDRVNTYVGRYSVEGGFGAQAKAGTPADKENRRKRQLLLDRVTQTVDRRQKEGGKPLTDIELDAIVRSNVVAVHRGGEAVPLYVARTSAKKAGDPPDAVNPRETFDGIPIAVRNRIIEGLQRRGIRPTPRGVIEVYLEGSK